MGISCRAANMNRGGTMVSSWDILKKCVISKSDCEGKKCKRFKHFNKLAGYSFYVNGWAKVIAEAGHVALNR